MFPTLPFRAASGPVSILWSLLTCRLWHASLSQTAARPCGLGDCGRELLAPCPEDKARPSRDDALLPSSVLDRRQWGLTMGLGFIPLHLVLLCPLGAIAGGLLWLVSRGVLTCGI